MAVQGSNYKARQFGALIILPTLIAAAVLVVFVVLGDRLPEQIATHWGANGEADGFTSRSALPWQTAGLIVALTVPMALLVMYVNRSQAFIPRALNGLPAWMASFLAAMSTMSLIPQVDTTEAPSLPFWVIVVALVMAFVGGSIGAAISGQPPAAPQTIDPAPDNAQRHPLADGQTAVWAGQTAIGRGLFVVLAAMIIGNVVVAAFTSWWVLFFLAIFFPVIVSMSFFNIAAGPSGLRVNGVLGFPKITVPLNEIMQASASSVRAVEFGGWGWRVRKGQTAVLTRSGSALTVTRTDGARLHITLDDPETPAAVISTLLDRRATV